MSIEALMGETAWLRRLAVRLVRDDDAADDLVAETIAIAVDRAPGDRPLRPWLHRVLVNRFRMHGRAAARRAAREQTVADRAASPPTPADLVERVETQRHLAGLVLALDEPYREVVLLRFVEDLASPQIAARLGIADGTVRWRLAQALAELRRKLDAEHGGKRAAWVAPIGAFATTGKASTSATATRVVATGALAMKKVLVAVAILILLVAGTVWYLRRDRGGPARVADDGSAGAGTLASHRSGTASGGALAVLPPWLVQSGAATGRIAGTVRSGGAVVAGATVALHVRAFGGRLAEATTDAAGRFDLGVWPPTLYTVSAIAPAHGPASTLVRVGDATAAPSPEHLQLELADCRARITGSVLDASGGPIAAARLRIDDLAGVDADAAGHYDLCLPGVSSRFTVAADGYATVQLAFQLMGTLTRDIVLVPESTVAGRVVRADTGAPLPGAIVVAVPDDRNGARASAISGADGRFELAGVAAGTGQLVATADGWSNAGATLRFTAAVATPHELELRLSPTVRIAGHVMAGSVPVPGAVVMIFDPRCPVRPPGSVSQADGSFVVDNVAPGDVMIAADPYAVEAPHQLVIDRAIADLAIAVEASAAIRGVVTRSGAPVAGVEVGCEQAGAGPGNITISHADGSFELTGFTTGTCMLYASNADAFADGRVLDVRAGTTTAANIELDRAAEVLGVVVDQDAAPVANAVVHLELVGIADQGVSMTDAAGRFHVYALRGGGDYRAAVYAEPNSLAELAQPAGAAAVAIHLVDGASKVDGVRIVVERPTATLTGVVVDATGSPVADVRVSARWHDDPRRAQSARRETATMTAIDGRFALTGLVAGHYVVHAHAADGSDAFVDADTGTDLRLAVARPGRIEGRLIGFPAGTAPIVYAMDRAFQPADSVSGVVDGDRFTIGSLAPGIYLVGAHLVGAAAGGAAVHTVDVQAGIVTEVELVDAGTARVVGRVVEQATHAPVGGGDCIAIESVDGTAGPMIHDWNAAANPKVGVDGWFTIERAPAGSVRVLCLPSSPVHSPVQADVDVAAGDTATVELVSVRRHDALAHVDPGFTLDQTTLPPTVFTVAAGGPASGAVATGDVITAVDGAATTGIAPQGVEAMIDNHRAGRPLSLAIRRGGATTTVSITVTAP